MIYGCGFVLWCSGGLFYGGFGFVSGGCAVLVVLCWRWIVFFFFFFFCSATRVCGCGWWADGGVGVCGSIGVRFGSVGGGVGFSFFFFFFLVLTVDYGLVVVVVSGVCSAAVVVIVVVKQK